MMLEKCLEKWDNVKLVSDRLSCRNKNRKILSESELWGINIKSKERYTRENQAPLPFGIIITLKSIDKKDYYDTFQRMCIAQNWMVTPIDIENNLDIYHIGTEPLELI